MRVFFVKSGKWGVFFRKKWTFPQRRVQLCTVLVFFFYFTLYLVGGAYALNRPDHQHHVMQDSFVASASAVCTVR